MHESDLHFMTLAKEARSSRHQMLCKRFLRANRHRTFGAASTGSIKPGGYVICNSLILKGSTGEDLLPTKRECISGPNGLACRRDGAYLRMFIVG
jgi:hypothetical protein